MYRSNRMRVGFWGNSAKLVTSTTEAFKRTPDEAITADSVKISLRCACDREAWSRAQIKGPRFVRRVLSHHPWPVALAAP
eukprot:1830763-Pleurochrysis_carterae.AAC.1